MKQITVFQAEDGKQFDTAEEAILWEQRCLLVKYLNEHNTIGFYNNTTAELVVEALLQRYTITHK